jgi:hypothetical protein
LLDYAVMLRRLRFGLAAFSLLPAPCIHADGIHDAAGVNLTAEEGFGARHSGMATGFSGFQRDANAVGNAPAAMNDVDDFAFATAHAEKFGEAKYDDFAFLFPFDARGTLGLGLARYGVSDIEARSGVTPNSSLPDGLFSAADYLVVGSFARRWGDRDGRALDVGTSVHLLYRQLDQDGFGVRADAMAQYTWADRYRVGALLKGMIPSAAKWESGYSEYEDPDLQLGAAAKIPAPYFYGTLEVAYQTEGLFQRRAKSQIKVEGARFNQSFPDAVATGNLGMEFLFDFGLSVRCGFSELYLNRDAASLATFGIGYNWRGIAGIDYSFSPHPDLLASHRLSLQFTPAFPSFNGRKFRTQGAVSARPSTQRAPASEEKPEPVGPAAQPAAPPDSSQTQPEKPLPPRLKERPAGGEKEILEED